MKISSSDDEEEQPARGSSEPADGAGPAISK